MPAGGRPKSPFRSGTKNPMGKDRVRDRKIKKISQMMERRESLRQTKKPGLKNSKPNGLFMNIKGKEYFIKSPKGTGGVNRGGFRKPDTSRIRPGALSNRKKVNKAGS